MIYDNKQESLNYLQSWEKPIQNVQGLNMLVVAQPSSNLGDGQWCNNTTEEQK